MDATAEYILLLYMRGYLPRTILAFIYHGPSQVCESLNYHDASSAVNKDVPGFSFRRLIQQCV